MLLCLAGRRASESHLWRCETIYCGKKWSTYNDPSGSRRGVSLSAWDGKVPRSITLCKVGDLLIKCTGAMSVCTRKFITLPSVLYAKFSLFIRLFDKHCVLSWVAVFLLFPHKNVTNINMLASLRNYKTCFSCSVSIFCFNGGCRSFPFGSSFIPAECV